METVEAPPIHADQGEEALRSAFLPQDQVLVLVLREVRLDVG